MKRKYHGVNDRQKSRSHKTAKRLAIKKLMLEARAKKKK
jgi:hypothetical protein